jgi:hypothetical protein
MDFEIEAGVYCHDIVNPPAHDRNCDINLEVKNSKLFHFRKGRLTRAGTMYKLLVPYARSAGLTDAAAHIFDYEFDDLILAFNLVLERVCVTTRSSEFSNNIIRREPPLHPTNIIRKDNKVLVNVIEDNIVFDNNIHATVIHSASIDERTVLDVIHNLQKFKRFQVNRNSSLQENNLKNALENYLMAMQEKQIISKFRDLFTALELGVNVDGKEREDVVFDKEAGNSCALDPKIVKVWRHFYNRTKHPHRVSKDIDTYYDAEKTLGEQLLILRKCVKEILCSRLK